ncbi:DUF6288 domain-containing protein [Alienimonas chondri]|uniref:Acetylesterase n=1 Tax=Alienimonas chondri TaxID=2681879 RepID=A0ABX1VDS4_9PLAN|nr:DUF6288 domain-containing protein [Alienimonas chondri]NNJ25412.1 hypothetical protein [Alienimonas chondri]
MPRSLRLAVALWAIAPLTSQAIAAPPAGEIAPPDFTAGDPIPDGWTQDWNLGPTGLRGWMFSRKLETTDARQIRVTQVDAGSPADGVIKVDDVLLGVGQGGVGAKPFDGDPRVLFGEAITAAETDANGGRLVLLRWRDGDTKTVELRLPVMGSYSPTAPFDCPKSAKIVDRGRATLLETMRRDPAGGHIIARSLNALALLAIGDERDLPLLKEQATILAEYAQPSGVRTWQYAYVNLFLAEYLLATGDSETVAADLKRMTRMIVDGQSVVGSWGHDFVRDDPRSPTGAKRLGGYGMMNAPGIPLTLSLVLAREALAQEPDAEVAGLDEAIAKSERFLRFYVGKGAIPYGDHRPWIQTHEDNGKNGMAAVLFDRLGDEAAADYFARMAVASHGPERDVGHTGPYFNTLWALPSVARLGPQATGAWLEESAWRYDLARRWDGSFLYQGAPGARPQTYRNWDCTGLYLLGYLQGTDRTVFTGRGDRAADPIDRATAEALVDAGRGWSNADRDSFYDGLSTEELLNRLASWSPTVRERAAIALGRSQADVSDELVALLDAPDLHARYGAAQALKLQRGRGAKAVPRLIEALQADDLWLRILAAEALAGIGDPARSAVPALLARFAVHDPEGDPRAMEQRYLAGALFASRGGLLSRSLEGVDRDALREAVRLSLQNEDGRARGNLSSIYRNLSFEELRPLLPAIREAIATPAPSGIMFADGIQTAGLELFAEHRIEEGIDLLAEYVRGQKQHGSQKRIVTILNLLTRYGAHAQRVIPELEAAAVYFETEEENFPRKLSLEKAKLVREAIAEIEASTARPELIELDG